MVSPTKANSDEVLKRWLPAAAGAVLVTIFVSLGLWQLDRAAQKNATRAAFENPAGHVQLVDATETERYQSLMVTGRYLAGQQILIDKVVKNGRLGYYVIAAFRSPHYTPLLVVNRGWVKRPAAQDPPPVIEADAETRTLRGIVGGLPKVGIRSGPVFATDTGWPRKAQWPELPDLARAWGQDVSPIVLQLDPADGRFLRQWQPPGAGPMTHYGYAAQWFAMAAALLAFLVWKRFLARRIAPG